MNQYSTLESVNGVSFDVQFFGRTHPQPKECTFDKGTVSTG